MPGFGQMDARTQAMMFASHSMSTYSLMDKAKVAPIPRTEAVQITGARDFETLLATGWIEVVEDMVSVTDDGLSHLKSF